MDIQEYPEGKIIILSKAFDTRAKILNIIYFAVFTGIAIAFANMAGPSFGNRVGITIFVIVLVGVYLLAGYRFINKALQTEKLVVNENTLTILKSGLLAGKNNAYHVNIITNLRHLDKPEITKHPLAGQSFDYLGFETQQQVINEMHGDAKIAFDYEGKTIKFGENIFSWDFEQIERTLHDITGKDFTHNNTQLEN